MKFKQLFKRTVLSTFLIALIAGLSFYIYLETSIDTIVEKSDMEKLISQINSSDPLPEIFYTVQEKYYPDKFTNGVFSELLNHLLGNQIPCPCAELYLPFIAIKSRNRFADLIVKLEIEEHCSARKCFEFTMQHSNFGSNKKGIVKASEYFFNKKVEDLSEDEILKFILILKGPTYYSPLLNPNRLEEGIRSIKEK